MPRWSDDPLPPKHQLNLLILFCVSGNPLMWACYVPSMREAGTNHSYSSGVCRHLCGTHILIEMNHNRETNENKISSWVKKHSKWEGFQMVILKELIFEMRSRAREGTYCANGVKRVEGPGHVAKELDRTGRQARRTSVWLQRQAFQLILSFFSNWKFHLLQICGERTVCLAADVRKIACYREKESPISHHT